VACRGLCIRAKSLRSAFTLKVQSVRKAWRYPDLTRVTFSDEKVDLVISGKERASEGKGFRTIAYAAFMIGLLDFARIQR
jgi:hypothetical protein